MKEDVSAYVENKIEELIEELQEYVNNRVNKFSRVQVVIIQPVPLKRPLPKRSSGFFIPDTLPFFFLKKPNIPYQIIYGDSFI